MLSVPPLCTVTKGTMNLAESKSTPERDFKVAKIPREKYV